MRSLILALAALAFATSAQATIHWGGGNEAHAASADPYHLTRAGKCVAANGRVVAKSYCAPQRHAKMCNPATSKPCGNGCIAKDKVCHAG